MNIGFAAVILAIVVFVFNLLRSRRMREKYAVLWILVGIAMAVLALAPALLKALAVAVGFEVPSNLLFFMAILLLLGVSLHLSLEVSRLEDETRVLAEQVAVLDLIVTEAGLADRPHGREPADDPPPPHSTP